MLNRNTFAAGVAVAISLSLSGCYLASNGLDYSHEALIQPAASLAPMTMAAPAPAPTPALTPAPAYVAPAPVSAAPAAATGSTAVSIQNFAFAPASLSIAVGTTVTWTNKDKASHTVSFPDQTSGNLTSGASFSKTFSAPGTYSYMCDYHGNMTGTVVVK